MARSPVASQGDPFPASASKARAALPAAAEIPKGLVGLLLAECPSRERSAEGLRVSAGLAVSPRDAELLTGLLAGLSVLDLQGAPLPAGPFPVSAVPVAVCDHSSGVRQDFVPERDV